MKTKFFVAAMAVAFSFAVSSCSGNKKADAAADNAAPATEQVEGAAGCCASDSAKADKKGCCKDSAAVDGNKKECGKDKAACGKKDGCCKEKK